jgi:hypothetical protein
MSEPNSIEESDKEATAGTAPVHSVSRRTLLLTATGTLIAGGSAGFFGGREYTLHTLRGRRKPRPAWPAHVPIEKWNPRHGAERPKVVIVEFNDFQ